MITGQNLAAATFGAALQPGPCKQPVALGNVLSSLSASQSSGADLDSEALEHSLAAEFSFMPSVFNGTAPSAAQAAEWEAAVRWVLQELQAWQPTTVNATGRLKALLATATALDVKGTGLKAVATSLTPRLLPAGLIQAIEQARVHMMGERHERIQKLAAELDAAAADSDFRSIKRTLRHLMVVAHSDLYAATNLLWAQRPADLAASLARQASVLKQYAICEVLGDEAPVFAHQVPSATFKYLAICAIEDAYRARRATHNWAQLLERLLLDVAGTQHWRSLMLALFEYPQDDVLPLEGLAQALAATQPVDWKAFIEALSLSYSKRIAQPVADVLSRFLGLVGPAAAQGMWDGAHQRWSAWDYGKAEPHFFMSSPQACALDYPVAMYYATLPAAQRTAEEARLQAVVDNLEITWFSQVTQLITERNRLLSHLRLVQHGSAMAAGGASALPPPVAPVDTYTEVRYRFHDVQRL